MHKVRGPSSAPPFRPIVSSIGTYNYNLAKFLCTLLDSYIPSDFCARDTFSFVNEITNLRTSNKFMVSFDVESLFTNIPLLESIELAVDYILSGNPTIIMATTTSAAKAQKVSITTIMDSAGWSSENTFMKYYNKTISKPTDNFGKQLLDALQK